MMRATSGLGVETERIVAAADDDRWLWRRGGVPGCKASGV